MLGLGRALGETMAVTFVIGNAHRISPSLLAPGTTISATIANEFTEAIGDLYTSSLVALGLILFIITFIVLAIARLLLMRLEKMAGSGAIMATGPTNIITVVSCASRHAVVLGGSRRSGSASLRSFYDAVVKGFAWLIPAVFVQMTPPPGNAGGLRNAIVGCLS